MFEDNRYHSKLWNYVSLVIPLCVILISFEITFPMDICGLLYHHCLSSFSFFSNRKTQKRERNMQNFIRERKSHFVNLNKSPKSWSNSSFSLHHFFSIYLGEDECYTKHLDDKKYIFMKIRLFYFTN